MRDVAPRAVTLAEVGDHLIVDRLRCLGVRHRGRFGDPGGEFLFGHVALVDEELGDAAQPLLVVAKLEVVEGFIASAPVRRSAHVHSSSNAVGTSSMGYCRQRSAEVVRQPHHRNVDAEDALLPIFHEDTLFQRERLR